MTRRHRTGRSSLSNGTPWGDQHLPRYGVGLQSRLQAGTIEHEGPSRFLVALARVRALASFAVDLVSEPPGAVNGMLTGLRRRHYSVPEVVLKQLAKTSVALVPSTGLQVAAQPRDTPG